MLSGPPTGTLLDVTELSRSKLRKFVFTALGSVFAGLAIAGIFVPLLPTTINAIIAGVFFAKGSERFDNWLLNHRVLGPIVHDHRNGIGFTTKAKRIAVTAMSTSIALSTWWAVGYRGAPIFVAYFMAGVWLYALWFILKQPTKPDGASSHDPVVANQTPS
jgi:uncharacterized membrane protein YbaN (DUF454 family)